MQKKKIALITGFTYIALCCFNLEGVFAKCQTGWDWATDLEICCQGVY